MNRRILAALLLIALALQGPLVAYAATLAAPFASLSGHLTCDGATVPSSKHCDSCCSDGIVPCSTGCALGIDAFVPPMSVPIVGQSRGKAVAEPYITPFVSQGPAQVFRPPIV